MSPAACTLVVLAAGASARFGRPKQLELLGPGGRTLIDYALIDAARAGFRDAVVVVTPALRPIMTERFGSGETPLPTRLVEQRLSDLPDGLTVPPDRVRPLGTAHAVWTAHREVTTPFAVVNADDFYGAASYRAAYTFLASARADSLRLAMVGYPLVRTLSPEGGVSRAVCRIGDDGRLASLTELLDVRAFPGGIGGRTVSGDPVSLSGAEVVSMNLWGFTPRVFGVLERELVGFLTAAGEDDLDSELHLPTVIDALLTRGEAEVEVIPSAAETFGITFEADGDRVAARLAELTASGEYPGTSARERTCN